MEMSSQLIGRDPPFPVEFVHGLHTPPPVQVRALPPVVRILEKEAAHPVDVAEISRTTSLEHLPERKHLVALYAALRPFLVL